MTDDEQDDDPFVWEQTGLLLVENSEQVAEMDLTNALVGLQYSTVDGRIWLCVNGVAFIRFKPTSQPIKEQP